MSSKARKRTFDKKLYKLIHRIIFHNDDAISWHDDDDSGIGLSIHVFRAPASSMRQKRHKVSWGKGEMKALRDYLFRRLLSFDLIYFIAEKDDSQR